MPVHIHQFDFNLPKNLIARFPLTARRDSRLMIVGGDTDQFTHSSMADFPALLRKGDLLVVNNTRVIPARLTGTKTSGGKVEIMLERFTAPDQALVQIGANRKVAIGQQIEVADYCLTITAKPAPFYLLQCQPGRSISALFHEHGSVPLPPYIGRMADDLDKQRYQTVFANRPGAVAAPTAGLHFDRELIEEITKIGVDWAEITLHVGAGTFKPVRAEDINQHQMHSEWIEVSQLACEKIKQTSERNGRIIAVGTTVVRTLESALSEGRIVPYQGETRLFITPGYKFRVVDALLTNFHLPKSTLLMMISAFAGHKKIMNAYQCAIQSRYRFFSYGDAMFMEKGVMEKKVMKKNQLEEAN